MELFSFHYFVHTFFVNIFINIFVVNCSPVFNKNSESSSSLSSSPSSIVCSNVRYTYSSKGFNDFDVPASAISGNSSGF